MSSAERTGGAGNEMKQVAPNLLLEPVGNQAELAILRSSEAAEAIDGAVPEKAGNARPGTHLARIQRWGDLHFTSRVNHHPSSVQPAQHLTTHLLKMTNMKAVQVKDVGKGNKAAATDLYIDEVAIPELKPGDVLVKVKAFGINRMDIMQRQGLYPVS